MVTEFEFTKNAVEQKAGSDQLEKLFICLPYVEFIQTNDTLKTKVADLII